MNSKPKSLAWDNLDDRREVWRLLHRLPPVLRVQWLAWCCKQVESRYGPVAPKLHIYKPLVASAGKDDRPDEILTNEVFIDWWRLASQYGLDQIATAQRLVEVVKRPK